MAAINAYATLAEFKDWIRPGGSAVATDTTDDVIVQRILGSASRYIDREARRTFYPRVQTRRFDVPPDAERGLLLDDDLLEIITLTNGDDNTIAASLYNLNPINDPPYYEIRLTEASTTYWEEDSSGNTEKVINVLGIWGFHEEYADRAWTEGSAINEDPFAAADTTLTVDDGTKHAIEEILKIDNELLLNTEIATHNLTVTRGENGSTDASHADNTQVYIWQPMEDIREACLLIAHNFYRKRTGQTVAGVAQVTAAGVVIRPQDIPQEAMDIIEQHTRKGWG